MKSKSLYRNLNIFEDFFFNMYLVQELRLFSNVETQNHTFKRDSFTQVMKRAN